MTMNGQRLLAAPLKDFALGELAAVRQVALDSHKRRKEQARREWQAQRQAAEIRQAFRDRQWRLSRGGK